MTIKRVPVRNAMTNENELLEGEIVDVLPDDHSVYVDRSGKTYNPQKGVRMSDLPTAGVTQFPRTTWYARDSRPGRERRTDAHTTNTRARPDALGSGTTRGGRRNGRARKAANARESLAVADGERGSSGRTE